MNVNCEVHHHHPTFIWDDIWNEIDAATSSFDSCRSGSDAPTRSLLIRNFWVVVPNIEPWLDIERSLRKFWLSVAAILQIAAAFSSTEEEGLLEIESTWKVRVTPNHSSKVCLSLQHYVECYSRPKYDEDSRGSCTYVYYSVYREKVGRLARQTLR